MTFLCFIPKVERAENATRA